MLRRPRVAKEHHLFSLNCVAVVQIAAPELVATQHNVLTRNFLIHYKFDNGFLFNHGTRLFFSSAAIFHYSVEFRLDLYLVRSLSLHNLILVRVKKNIGRLRYIFLIFLKMSR